MKQLAFSSLNRTRLTFGGSLLGPGCHPKNARPIDSKFPMHLVLKAESSAMRLPKNFKRVNEIVATSAKKYGIRLYEFANCGDHLHVLLKLPRCAVWRPFVREVTGRIAKLTRVRWRYRPFTRIVKGWRKAFAAVKQYIQLNTLEVTNGVSRRMARALRDLHARYDVASD